MTITARHLGVIATLSLATALTLGWIDYETRTIGDLFAAQNLPALLIFTAMAFVLFTIAWIGIVAVSSSLRSARGRA